MPTTAQLVRLTEPQVAPAAGVLARAFRDDPLFAHFVPDPAARREKLPAFMVWCCRYGQRFGDAWAALTADRVAGVAFWMPPDAGDLTPERLAATGFGQVADAFGEEAMGRFGAVMGHLEELHRQQVPAPHWYLLGIGVDPPLQGQGIGGQLLQPGLRQADAARLPCYLETQQARNVPLYRRHGFAVVGETDPPGGGPHLWLMARPPQQGSR